MFQICLQLGWKSKRTSFDVLPLVLSANGHDPEWFDIPSHLVLEIEFTHPEWETLNCYQQTNDIYIFSIYVTKSYFRCWWNVIHFLLLSISYCAVFVKKLKHVRTSTGMTGSRTLDWNGTVYLPCPACCLTAEDYYSQLHHSMDGTWQRR